MFFRVLAGFWARLGSGALLLFGGFAFLLLLQPDVGELRHNTYKAPLQVYSQDGVLLAEYGEMKRLPISIEQVPPMLIATLVAVEDQRFFEHVGLDWIGLLRALRLLVSTGEKKQGASTLTMQVARNFYLTREKTFFRKLNEVFLALMIERKLSKHEILELYINKIFLGARSYGFRAASKTYFAKDLHELTPAETAMLVSLPKAPSHYNPVEHPVRAKQRRDFVLTKMFKKDIITETVYKEALLEPITTVRQSLHTLQKGTEFIAELARSAAVKTFGREVYESGLKIYTTVDYVMQRKAQEKLAYGLEKELLEEDWHVKKNFIDEFGSYSEAWKKGIFALSSTSTGLEPAVIVEAGENLWAYKAEGVCVRVQLPVCAKGAEKCPIIPDFRVGDQIFIKKQVHGTWTMGARPSVQGALVSLEPHSGQLRALVGGYQFQTSHFNRALQLARQSGSVIKPFLYAAAIDRGFTMASLMQDMPVVEAMEGREDWRPKNVDQDFKGVMRLRESLIASRNLVSVRLVKQLGGRSVASWLQAFGFTANYEQDGLSLALGVTPASPLQMARSYAAFANQGVLPAVHWLDKVVNASGEEFLDSEQLQALENSVLPGSLSLQSEIMRPEVSYIVADALHDVIKRGTGRRARVLKRSDLYGKTGTTNNNSDAWFAGFSQDAVTVVWVGHDDHRPLTGGGAKLALPIWIDYMHSVFSGIQAPLIKPEGIVSVRIDKNTGRRASAESHDTVFEIFEKTALPAESVSKEQGDEHSFEQTITLEEDENAVMEALF